MKRRILSILMALTLCLGLLPGTVWAEEVAADGGDITATGLSFYSPSNQTPRQKMVYHAGEGTVTWIPTLDGSGNITHGTFIFENTTFSMNSSPVLRYVTDPNSGVDGNVDVIIKGQNTITASNPYSYIFDISRNSVTSADQHPTLTIKGENGGSLTYNNTATTGGGYSVTSVRNTVSFENIKMDLRNGALEIYGLIKIKDSEINITLDGAGVPSYRFALQTHSGGGTYPNSNIGLTVEKSKITIDSNAKGISAPPQCDFTDSEIEVRIPYSSGGTNKAISTNYDKIHVVRSTVKAIGGGGPVVLPGYDFVDSNSDFWNELDQSIYVAGGVSISPETSNKQLVAHQNCRLTIENDAAFDTMLYDGTVFTAANVKNLSISRSENAKILLTDEIPSITVSGDITNNGWLTLEYEGSEPKSPVVLTAKTAEDAAKIEFDTDKFELKENQIVWKQTPLAAPTGLSWDGAKAQWTAVENAQGYTVQLRKDGEDYGKPVTVTSAAEYDFTDQITETGSYTFTVKAMGGSILYADSEYSGASGAYEYIAPEKYAVTFDSRGGTAVAGQEVVENETASRPVDPTRGGYTFGGWFTDAECTAVYDFSMPVTENLTLYAKWTASTPPPSPGGDTPSNPGGSSGSNGGSSSGSAAPALPVTTTGQNSAAVTTTTTAVPPASASGGTATVTVDTSMGNEIVKQAVENNSETVVIAPKITGNVTETEVSIPAAVVGQLGRQTSAGLTVSTPVAGVTIPNGGLAGLASAGGTVAVTAERTGNALALTVTAGGRSVDSIPGGLTLTVPANNTTPGTVAVLVYEDGMREVVRKSVTGNGSVTIPLDGSAKLEIVDNSKQFADVPTTSWAADAVAFVSAHELFNSTGTNQFSPSLSMSRGMLAVVLHNLENNPAQAFTGAFADVDNNQWYAEGVSWAEARGIISGYGDGRFGPNDSITREQLAVMFWRYAGSPAAVSQELRFADADKASGWALDALRWATESGILRGKGNGILDPAGQATRAEAAQMLKNFMEKQ